MKKNFFQTLASATLVTVLAQLLGLLRQSLVISYFGFSSSLDVYQTAYAIGALTVFSLNVIVESVLTSIFAKIRENEGLNGLRKYIGWYLSLSCLVSVIAAAFFLFVFPWVAFLYAVGFTERDFELLQSLRVEFVPLVILGIIYFSISAAVKSLWRFNAAFSADLALMIASIVGVYFYHENVGSVALAYAFGYLIGVIFLAGTLFFERVGFSFHLIYDFPYIIKRSYKHYGALQYASVTSLIERIWMSYLPAGGISGLSASQQLIMGLTGVLSFRDAYLVPLGEVNNRAKRIKTLVLTMVVLSSAVAGYFLPLAEDVVVVLFDYGKVKNAELTMVAGIFSYGLVGMISTSVANPLWRFLQMEGEHKRFIILYTYTLISTFVLGWFLVKYLGIGVNGIAIVSLLNSTVGCLLALLAVRKMHDFIRDEDFIFAIFSAILIIALGFGVSLIVKIYFNAGFARLLIVASIYFPLIFLLGFAINDRYKILQR